MTIAQVVIKERQANGQKLLGQTSGLYYSPPRGRGKREELT